MRKNTESNLLAARLSCCCDSCERKRSTIDERTRENKREQGFSYSWRKQKADEEERGRAKREAGSGV
jgi:hypothetical protein